MTERGGGRGQRAATLLLALLILWLTPAGGVLAQPAEADRAEYFLVRQRGPSIPVLSVSVDTRGFVWSAGPGGACRFDGLSTRCLSYGSAQLVSAASASPDVWAVFSNGALRRVYPATPAAKQWQVSGSPTALLVTQDRVWVSTSSGLFVLDKASKQPTLLSLSTAATQSLASVDGGDVLALTNGQIFRYDAHLRPVPVASEIPGPVSGVFPGTNGGWLATTPRAIWRADQGKPGFLPIESTLGLRKAPLTLMATRDDALWIGTFGGILYQAPGANKLIEVKGLPFASPHFAVRAVAASASDRVWLATPLGLFEVQSRFPSKTLSHASGDGISIAFAVAPSPEGVWFSSGLGIDLWAPPWVISHGRAEGLKTPDLRAVALDGKGNVWAGGIDSGLFKLDRAKRRFLPQTAIWPRGVRAILPSNKGGLWLGLSPTGLARAKDSRTQVLLPMEPNGANEVLDMVENADGSLWVAFRSEGVALVREDHVEYMPLPSSVRGVEVLCLLEDGEGGVLAGTDGKGLFRIANGEFQRVTVEQGLGADHIHGLTSDHEGRLWLSSPNSVAYAQRSEVIETLKGRQQSFHSVVWGREEGITGEPIRAFPKAAATMPDGTLAFPSLDGLIRIDPALIRTPAPPEVVLDEIDFGGGGFNQNQAADVRHFRSASAQIRFSFSAPKHPRPHRLKFRFRLLGLETAWRVESGNGEARYAGVTPGTYHFEVQALAATEDGGPSAVVSATAIILPPWYSTWQLRALALALAVAAIFWRHKVRTARATKLLDAKAAERRRIAADIHDGLSQDLVGLRLQLEAAQASIQKDPTTAQKFLHRAGLLLEDGLKDLRDSIWGLNHDEVDTDSLANGLRERLVRSTQDTAVSLSFECQGERRSLAPAEAWQITQIAREAVANAIKHAAAKHIAVSLCTVGRSITLAVEDDGRGIEGALANPGVGRGFGLAGMKARAEALGALLRVQNNPSGGTRIELVVPDIGLRTRKRSSPSA